MARVEAPRFHNPWEEAGRAIHFAVTRGLFRESLLNPHSYYRVVDHPLSAGEKTSIPAQDKSAFGRFINQHLNARPFIQYLTRVITDLSGRLP